MRISKTSKALANLHQTSLETNNPIETQTRFVDGFIVYKMYLSIRLHFENDRTRKNPYRYHSMREKGRSFKNTTATSSRIRIDATLNSGLVQCSKASYERRKHYYMYGRLADHFGGIGRLDYVNVDSGDQDIQHIIDIEDYLIANLVENPYWGAAEYLLDTESLDNYVNYKKRIQSLMYNFEEDMILLRKACIKEYEKLVSEAEKHGPLASIVASDETMSELGEYCSPEGVDLNSVYFKLCVLTPRGQQPLIVRETLGRRIGVETLSIFSAVTGCSTKWNLEDPTMELGIKRILKYAELLEYDPEVCKDIIKRVWLPK